MIQFLFAAGALCHTCMGAFHLNFLPKLQRIQRAGISNLVPPAIHGAIQPDTLLITLRPT